MRPDVHGLGGHGRATVEGRGRELNGVVAVGCKAVRRVAGAGGAVAERPRRWRETHATRVERLVEKLDDIEGRGVERKESKVGDRRRRDFKVRSEEHTSELQSQSNLVCRLLLEKKSSETRSRGQD